MNRLFIGIVIAVLAVAGILWLVQDGEDNVLQTTTPTPTGSVSPSPTATAMPDGKSGSLREFTVTASNYKFSVAEMRVKEGDTVRVTLRNQQGLHDWVIDEFNAETNQLQSGEQQTIEFIADDKGTFEYYCSVGNHRAMGMVGKLIVE